MKCVLVCVAVLVSLCSGAFAAKGAASKSTTKINPKDGSVMITIPAGEFVMGSDGSFPDEKPAHKVYLDSYQIGKYEVTVDQYRRFCKATGIKMPIAPDHSGWKDNQPVGGWKVNHPMEGVTWDEAVAYCKWAGGTLPTEAQWEKAARGADGRDYPWGSTWDQSKCANAGLRLTSAVPVGSYPAGQSPYGCMDMAGNVWEWCADGWSNYSAAPSRNPKIAATGEWRVLRGGSWSTYMGSNYRCAYRFREKRDTYHFATGFRLARSSGALVAKTAPSKSMLKATRKNDATRFNPKDGPAMIIIRAGEFTMGSDGSKRVNEQPAHRVYLSSYDIGKYEVTVGQYRKFCAASGRQMPKAPYWGWKNDHPMVNVSWDDANAYCTWAGGRLPTEAEWEKAARGTDGRTFPWGSTWDVNKCANAAVKNGCLLDSPASVGSYPADTSPYGCMDMAGNVWEWCADWYGESYYKIAPSRDPKGPSTGICHVLRGGSWFSHSFDEYNYRCASRFSVGYPYGGGSNVGFRLAR